jgi:hypothetical protein
MCPCQTLGFGTFVTTRASFWFLKKFTEEVVASPKHGNDDEELLPHVRRKFGR